MCLSCGCLKPGLKHGPNSITLDDILAAAKEHGIDPLDAYRNLLDGFDMFYSELLDATYHIDEEEEEEEEEENKPVIKKSEESDDKEKIEDDTPQPVRRRNLRIP